MKKGIVYTAIAGVVIVATAVGAYAVANSQKEQTTAPTETSSVSEVTESTTAPASERTTQPTTTEAESTAASTTAPDASFYKKGYYYIYNDKNTLCNVLAFKNNGKVDYAQFDESNIVYEDPQYFKGFAKYTIKGDVITVTDVNQTAAFELVIKDGSLYLNGAKVEKHKNLSMSYALKHFNK